MRLVSQDGIVDIPYEQVGLSLHSYGGIGKFEIVVNELQNGAKIARMGAYSDKDRALMVMSLVRIAYGMGESVYRFPTKDPEGSDA